MKSRPVKEFITPVDNFLRISADATLLDAYLAYVASNRAEWRKEGPGRTVLLVEDGNGEIIGSIDVFDLLRGLEPRYNEVKNYRQDSIWIQNPQLIREMIKHYQLWERPMEDVCKKATDIQVKDILDVDTQSDCVPSDTTLDAVIHQMIMGQHDTLLVMENGRIIGAVRLAEVFAAVYDQVEKCSRG